MFRQPRERTVRLLMCLIVSNNLVPDTRGATFGQAIVRVTVLLLPLSPCIDRKKYLKGQGVMAMVWDCQKSLGVL
jgi:hypothetical protein